MEDNSGEMEPGRSALFPFNISASLCYFHFFCYYQHAVCIWRVDFIHCCTIRRRLTPGLGMDALKLFGQFLTLLH